MASEFPCEMAGCVNNGRFHCKRCKISRYCSALCQKSHWSQHKLTCVGEIQKPYQWSSSVTITSKDWLKSRMKNEPDQPMDPPEKYSYMNDWWNDRELYIRGKMVVRASFYPPQFKEILRKGLREKDITWDYIMSDNFMVIALYSYTPVQYMLEILEDVMIYNEVKPRGQGLLENLVEHFWRVRGCPGQLDYNPKIYAMLRRNNVTLPFEYGSYNDEFRLYTHPVDCKCYSCLCRPYQEEKKGEIWEGLRLKASKKGYYMMSWDAKKEYEQKLYDDSLWDIDTSKPGEVENWRYDPDERRELRTLTKNELAEVYKKMNIITREQRLPTHTELDWIMSKISVPKEEFLVQERARIANNIRFNAHKSSSTSNNTSPATTTTTTVTSKTAAAAASVVVGPVAASSAGSAITNAAVTTMAASASSSSKVNSTSSISDLEDNFMTASSIAITRPRRRASSKIVSYADTTAVSSGDEDDPDDNNADQQHHCQSIDSDGSDDSDNSSFHWSTTSNDDDEDDEDDDDSSDILSDSSKDTTSSMSIKVTNNRRKGTSGSSCKKSSSSSSSSSSSLLFGGATNRFTWNTELDELLIKAVSTIGKNWVQCAGLVGQGVNNIQCHQRWLVIDPALKEGNTGPWSTEEIETLKILVADHVNNPLECKGSSRGRYISKASINWKEISIIMKRPYRQCCNQWKSVQSANMKKGPFSAEEDIIIRQAVLDWGENGGRGLWVKLAAELGRPAHNVMMRWNVSLSKK